MSRLRRLTVAEVPALRRDPVDDDTLARASAIVAEIQSGGAAALRAWAERLGDVAPGAPLVIDRAGLELALKALPREEVALLERVAARVRGFAEAHLASIRDFAIEVPGGHAGVRHAPVERAGCYAPGGRYPLPSSVLMTAVTARVAGVREVWVASPKPSLVTLAAAAVAGADALLAVGGAQAIGALAYGAGEVPAVDAIVGPGNRWVTAAKQRVAGRVAIDMLAGPSELVVVADDSADPDAVAADLLAQAEHDPDALPMLVALSAAFLDRVDAAIARQLADLPTAEVATAAVAGGFAVAASDLAEAADLVNRLAPEHLALHLADAQAARGRFHHYGALFVGHHSAEVLGDYGIGPNHVLPTGGTARSSGGLSVLTFLRPQAWVRGTPGGALAGVAADSAALARLEGLEAHARAAELRATPGELAPWEPLLAYWLGEVASDGRFDPAKFALWFGRSEATDADLRARFGALHARAAAGELEAWASEPRGRLALVILLDQLSRNLGRDTPAMYANDPAALALAEAALAAGEDALHPPAARQFLYLPLMHAEDRAVQARCVDLYARLLGEVAEAHRGFFRNALHYAFKHQVVVERFGRFPHRNEILGRGTTPEEGVFLEGPDSRF